MKFKFLSGPRTGQIDHAPNSQEISILAKAGIIEIIPYKGYQERLAAEHSTASGHGSVDPNSKGVEWGIKDRAQSPLSQVTIIKRSGCATTFYSTPPTDCPASVVERWKSLTQVADAEVVAEHLVQLKNKAITQASNERVGVLATLFGSK